MKKYLGEMVGEMKGYKDALNYVNSLLNKDKKKEEAKEAKEAGKFVATSTYTTITETWDFEEEVEVTAYYIMNENSYSDYNGYVSADGTIIRAYNAKENTLMHPILYTFTTQNSTSFAGSAWGTTLCGQYLNDTETNSFIIDNEVVTFNVHFTDANGKAVAAKDAYKQDYLNVLNEKNEIITAYVNNGEELVKVDGYQGTYTNRFGTLVLDGCGNAVFQGTKGTYIIDDMYVIADGMTYDIVLDRDSMTYEFSQKLVKVTYHIGLSAYNDMVPYSLDYELDVLDNTKDKKFMGWYIDELFEEKVVVQENGTFMPLADIQLFAKWCDRVDVTLVNVKDGDESEIVYGVTEILAEADLPYYGDAKIDLDNWKVFRGWYLDEAFEERIPAEAEITTDYVGVGITLYGKWEDLPEYYGTYYGGNVWSNTSIASSFKKVEFDEDGNITGAYNAKVTGYDPATGIITIGANSILFNKELGILATAYGSLKTASDYSDFDLYVRTSNSVDPIYKNFGLKYNMATETSASVSKYITRFVEIKNDNGSQIILLGDAIYAVSKITDVKGTEYSVADLNVKDKGIYEIIAKDAEDVVILAVGDAKRTAICDSSAVLVKLDNHYGYYNIIGEQETVTLDGLGNYLEVKGGKYYVLDDKAVMLVAEEKSYLFAATSSGGIKMEAIYKVEYDLGEGSQTREVPFYVPIKLEKLDDTTTKVFRGYVDQDNNPIEEFMVTWDLENNIKSYKAVWEDIAVLTIDYNDGTGKVDTVNYAVGETATVERPVYEKHAFVKWELSTGGEWVSDTEMTESITIKAIWKDAPLYNQNYQVVIVKMSDKNGGKATLDDRSAAINIDPYGYCKSISSYPFSGYSMQITESISTADNNIMLSIQLSKGTTKQAHKGVFVKETGLIIMSDANASNYEGTIYLLVPEKASNAKSNISVSYSNAGKVAFVSYKFGGNTSVVGLGIEGTPVTTISSFTSLLDSEAKLTAADYYGAESFAVTYLAPATSNTKQIAFAYDQNTKQMVDVSKSLIGKYVDPNDPSLYVTLNGLNIALYKGLRFELVKCEAVYEVENNIVYVITPGEGTLLLGLDDGKIDFRMAITKSIDLGVDTIFIPLFTELNIDDLVEEYLNYSEGKLCVGVTINDVPYYTGTLRIENISYSASLIFKNKTTLTVNFAEGPKEYYFAEGAKISFDYPTEPVNGQLLVGWTKNGEPYTLGTISEDMEITAVYETVHDLYGSYKGYEIWGTSVVYSGSGKKLVIDKNGKVTDGSVIKNYTINYSEQDGYYVTGRKLYADPDNGIIVVAYDATSKFTHDIYIFAKCETISIENSKCSVKNNGLTKFITATIDNVAVNMFLYNEVLYYNVSYTSGVTSATAGTSTGFEVWDATGNPIASF